MAPQLMSVIIPAKNQAGYLPDAMASLTTQFTDPSALQVIVVDDGSTDGTADIAADYAGRLPHLEIMRNEESRGLATARNQGIDASRGEYLAFLDGDDWLAPGHFDVLTERIRALECDFLRVDHIRCVGSSRTTHRAPQARRNTVLDPRASILPGDTATMVDYCYAWAGMFHRRLADSGLLRFPDGLFTAEDRPWAWRLHLQARSYAVVDAPGILYRRGLPASLTSIYDQRQLDFLPSFRQVFELVDSDREAARFWPKAARMFLAVLAHHLGRAKNMRAVDRSLLRTGARETLAMIPGDVLHGAMRRLGSRRVRLLSVLPRTVRVTQPAALAG